MKKNSVELHMDINGTRYTKGINFIEGMDVTDSLKRLAVSAGRTYETVAAQVFAEFYSSPKPKTFEDIVEAEIVALRRL